MRRRVTRPVLPGHDVPWHGRAPWLTLSCVGAQAEFGAFLRARRDGVQPQDVGLDAAPGRRVPGLRREELAMLADVSVDYLRRLEQGRVLPSYATLDAIADALRLGQAERAHLDALADRARGRRSPLPDEEVGRPSLLRILDVVSPAPAVILGRRCDVLAWNATGAALDPVVANMPPGERNVARRVLLDPTARDLYPEWSALAGEVADVLRRNRARFAEDERLAALVDELLDGSEAFRRLWRRNDVFAKTFGRKVIEHPEVGRLDLDYEAFTVPSGDGQELVVYTAEPGSRTAAGLRRLAAMVRRSRRPARA
jgi:transcriptional regulator with XRE-family HTH domain